MFGRRPDGRAVKHSDPIVRLTPYIMTRRSDAQVFINLDVDDGPLTDYIRAKRAEGIKMSHMAVIVAAWLRTVSEYPALNRFVCGSGLYARNEVTLSFVTLSGRTDDGAGESLCKLYFDPRDTIFEVNAKLEAGIEKCRTSTSNSAVNRLANALLSIPLLSGAAIALLKGMDKIGLLPKAIIDASPFHTSLFISNMASIKMSSIYHHIYDFGTTSVFFGMGRKTLRLVSDVDGKIKTKKVLPIGCVIDERIMSGAQYGVALSAMNTYFRHPERLEVPPETVKFDSGVDSSLKEKYRNV